VELTVAPAGVISSRNTGQPADVRLVTQSCTSPHWQLPRKRVQGQRVVHVRVVGWHVPSPTRATRTLLHVQRFTTPVRVGVSVLDGVLDELTDVDGVADDDRLKLMEAVGVSVAESDTEDVDDGVDDGVADTEPLTVAVSEPDAVMDGVLPNVALFVSVAVLEGVRLGEGVDDVVALPVLEGVCDGDGEPVDVAVCVGVMVLVPVSVGVPVPEGVCDDEGVPVAVSLDDGELVPVSVGVGVDVGELEGVCDDVGVLEGDADGNTGGKATPAQRWLPPSEPICAYVRVAVL
jgi:hypothetical protein